MEDDGPPAAKSSQVYPYNLLSTTATYLNKSTSTSSQVYLYNPISTTATYLNKSTSTSSQVYL